MYDAPAVCYPVGRSRLHAALVGCASLTSAVALLFWSLQTDQTQTCQIFAGSVSLLSTAWAALDWWRAPVGELQFSGQVWRWVESAQAQPVTIAVAFDFQRNLLLEIDGLRASSSWIWLEQRRKPQLWIALRRAIYATRQRDNPVDQSEVPT